MTHRFRFSLAMPLLAFALSGCLNTSAGSVAGQVATSAISTSVTKSRHINRFRGMDCDRINAEIKAAGRTFVNPIVGDGGYLAAAKQVAAEKNCEATSA